MKTILSVAFLLLALTSQAQKECYLLAGTYTDGKSKGIYVYKFNTETADNSLVNTMMVSNPSYLAISPDEKFVYAVSEDSDNINYPNVGSVNSFSFDHATGILSEINSQASGGKHPCYVSTDKTGRWLFVGNYTSGTVSLFPVSEVGTIQEIKQLVKHNGSGPDTGRQRSAHVHSTVLSADQRYLFVPDLGMDKIMIYQFDNKKGKLTAAPVPFARSKPGSGPRHFEFDKKNRYAYLMEEMTGTVVVYKFEKGKPEFIQRINALPAGFKGAIGSADIHVSPDGNYLYCSNRGESNDISIFGINKATGKLILKGHQSTLGIKPRNFNFDPTGNFLLVANQQSDEIVIFKIDKQTGLLTDTNKRISIPSPVCIKWIR